MGAIASLLLKEDQHVERKAIDRMTTAMAHRGPHGSTAWVRGPIGLGHAKLLTCAGVRDEDLPLFDPSADVAITADARLDNRSELAALLDVGNGAPRRVGDAELILRAYERWGLDCPVRLLGDFAFVIWDGPRRRLVCARDHLGVKPLVYHRSHRLFACASEIKGLLAHPGVPRQVNEERIADYLVDQLEGIDHTSTFYLDIQRLPPAHTLVIERGQETLRRYWSLDPDTEICLGRDDQYAEAFRDLFREAVKCRLRGVQVPASMLSGGMDSSAIVAVARDILEEEGRSPLNTFSCVSYDDRPCEETRSVRAVLAQGRVRPHTVRTDQVTPFVPDFERVSLQTDDLFDNLINHVPLVVYAAARRCGVTVLLDGVDGDRVASHGLGYIGHLLGGGRLIDGFAEAFASRHFRGRGYPSPWRLLAGAASSALARSMPPKVGSLARRRPVRATVQAATAGTIISQDFAKRIDLRGRLERLRAQDSDGRVPTARSSQAIGLQHPYLAVALERYDRVAAALSIEPRHPFLDRRLVEFCLALPWDQKVHRGWTKVVLRRATANVLPEQVVWRRGCEHLGPAFTKRWYALEKDLVDSVLEQDLGIIEPYVDTTALLRYRQRSTSDRAEEGDANRVWKAVTLARWLAVEQGREGRHVACPKLDVAH